MPLGVLFYQSFHDALKDLPDQDRLNAYDAVLCYGLYGEIIEMTPTVKMLFYLMRPNIDSSKNRYKASTDNGGKPPKPGSRPRGRPRKNQSENQNENQNENQDSENDYNLDLDSERKKELECASTTPTSPKNPAQISESIFEKSREIAKQKIDHYLPPDIADLRKSWFDAVKTGKNLEALDVTNKLFRLGYNIDPSTGDLSKRS